MQIEAADADNYLEIVGLSVKEKTVSQLHVSSFSVWTEKFVFGDNTEMAIRQNSDLAEKPLIS